MKFYLPCQITVNVTLFGNRVFADVLVKMRSIQIRVGPLRRAVVRRGEANVDTHRGKKAM